MKYLHSILKLNKSMFTTLCQLTKSKLQLHELGFVYTSLNALESLKIGIFKIALFA